MSAPPFVLVRGAGDLATGVILSLCRAGYLVGALEIERPTAIRRAVSLSEAMYEGEARVEGTRALRVGSAAEFAAALGPMTVPILADPEAASAAILAPFALVDAIIAKRNLGTRLSMAGVVVALGPGFVAGADCHAVVETKRGPGLGRVIREGGAEPDSGVPGLVEGYGSERVVHAPSAGRIEALREIGGIVAAGEAIASIAGPAGSFVVASPLGGALRGLIRPGIEVRQGAKIADVDPRGRRELCFSVSDKAWAVGAGVLEALRGAGHGPGA